MYHAFKNTPGTSRILSNGVIKCIDAVYTKICIRTSGIYYIMFLVGLLVSYICFTTRSLQYPDWCGFQKEKEGSKQ